MNYWGQDYGIVYFPNSLLATLVFVLTATVYCRTRVFNFETITFIQLSFSLAWLIECYLLSPAEAVSFTITKIMLEIFPISLFLFYCAFIGFKNKPIIISGTLFIFLINLYSYKTLTWEYSIITAIAMCFVLFFFTRFTTHYYSAKYQRFFLYMLMIMFIPYLILQNINGLFPNRFDWLLPIIYNYQLPNYFLLIFPFVLGYKLIKNNELEFTLKLRDYLLQLVVVSGLIGIISYLFLTFLNIPYGTLLLLLVSIYLVYFIVLNWQQHFFWYRFRNHEQTDDFIPTERTQLRSNVSYGDYLNSLSDMFLNSINSTYAPNGICLIQKRDKYFIIFAATGSLDKLKITKTLKQQLTRNTDSLLYKGNGFTKKDLLFSNQTIGWLLMDTPTLNPPISITKNIAEILFLTEELEKRQSNFIPEYVSIYKETLRDTTYLKKMEKLRKEISYYLHDDVLQNILALKKISELAINDPTKSDSSLRLIENELGNMNLKIREKMFDLYPSSLMDFSFDQSVRILVNQIVEERQSDTLPDFEIDVGPGIDVPKELRFTIYRILKELINNAVKYAKANNIKIEMFDDLEFLHISVNDDGVGFVLKEKIKSVKSGFGLLSIMQEVDSLSGQIQIKSTISSGTSIEISLNRERISY